MTLDPKALAVTGGVLVGGSFLLVGLVNLMSPGYGLAFLEMGKSLYPGYAGPGGFGGVVVVTLYGVLDGAVGGAVLAWVYNLLLPKGGAPVS